MELPKELQDSFKDIFSGSNAAVQNSWAEACDEMENTSMFGSGEDE